MCPPIDRRRRCYRIPNNARDHDWPTSCRMELTLSHAEGREELAYSQEAWMKHLEFIQAIITRLATNSFLVRGWGLTISGALFGFAASHLSWTIATVGLLPIIVFWYLDAYFLRQERIFRSLYNGVAEQDQNIPPFSLNPAAYRDRHSWSEVFK